MNDITPELLDKIEKEFEREFQKNSTILEVLENIKNKTATYKDANKLSVETGKILSNAFKNNISKEVLPDGKMYYNIANRVLNKTLNTNHNIVSNTTANIQTIINKSNGINVKGVSAELNQDRIDGLVEKVVSYDDYDKAKWVLNEPIINFSQSIVDDTLKSNIKLHSDLGLKTKVVRKMSGKCCEWCREVVGKYTYPDVPEDVYKRHRYCRCTTEYDAGDGKKRDIWKGKSSDFAGLNKKQIEEYKHTYKKVLKKKKKQVLIEKAKILKNKDEKLEKINKRIENSKKKKYNKGNKREKFSKKDLDEMTLPELRKLAKNLAIEHYESGKSGISFGKFTPSEVAEKLVKQGNRTSLKKDILSIQKKLSKEYKANYKKLDVDSIKPYQSKSDIVFAKMKSKSSEQLNSVRDYYTDGYTEVNRYLSKGDFSLHKRQIDVDNIDKAMEKFALEDDIVVYRGVKAKYYKNYKVGDTIDDGIFFSTSYIESNADDFMEMYIEDYQEEAMKLEIKVPQNTRCLYVGSNNTAYGDEGEFILSHKLKYKVLEMKNEKLVIEVLNE